MILTHLAVTDVRGITKARFGPFSERLNLLYGPNESGKSTLVESLRFGLFERSAGEAEHKRELRSWGGTGAPEIEVGFLDDRGDPWTVYKRFLDRPSTELASANTTLRGEEAERRLRELMGTKPGNRLGVTDADLGIWPLLWVRQGEAGRTAREAITEDARSKLSATLASTTGEIAVGQVGRQLLERARALAAESWTELDKPRNALKAAIEAREAAERAVADLEDQLTRHHALVREVDELQVELASLGRRRDRLADNARALAEKADAASAFRASLDALEPRTALARLEHDEAERRLADRDQREAELTQALAQADAARAQAAQVEAELARLTAQQSALRAQISTAAREAGAAHATVSRVLLRRERDALARQHSDLQSRVTDATALEQRIATLLHAIAAARVSPDAVDKLDATLRDVDKARARLDAVAVTVRVTAMTDQKVDGAGLKAGDVVEKRTVGALVLAVGGAQIEVLPGGDLTARQAEVDELERRAQRALDALGVPDVSAARQRIDAQRAREVELKGLRDRLAALAPGGIGPLQAEVTALAERIAEGSEPGDLPDYARAEGAARIAEASVAELRARAEILDSTRQAVIVTLAEHRSALRAAETDITRVQARLAATPDRASLVEASGRTAGALGALLTERDALTRAWTDAGGEGIAREHSAEVTALAGIEGRYVELRDRSLRAQASLDQAAQAGLYSQLLDARDALDDATTHAAALQRAADAARAVSTALHEARRGLEERFSAPVREIIAPWVDIMFPGSDLAIDPDSGHVIGIRTGRTVERFEDLSAGARDQLAILVRLGVARVISGGQRLPVLLDDALVNADDRRRQRMLEVLRQASAHLQVLVFTCHDAEFDRLGADWAARVAGRAARG